VSANFDSMNTPAAIRELYRPLQPTIKQSDQHVTYTEFLPDTYLQKFIFCYWQLKTDQKLSEPFTYRVIADGCIDIYFELTSPNESFVMGFCKKFTEFPLGNSFNYVGVRFLPTMFPQLFKINAADLSNRYEQLELVVPDLAKYIADHAYEAMQSERLIALFNLYFKRLISQITFDDDHRLYNALAIILRKFGVVDVEHDLDTGLSPRQLRRLFEFYIGDTAKTFSKVVRFQNILRAKPSKQSLLQNKLFFDAGYYDQSHFIKEFKNLYGVTPAKAFGR
jgi:hypothetical protein